MSAPEKPRLIWDGECGFCRRSAERIGYQVGDALEVVPYQAVAAEYPGQTEAFAKSVHLLEDGRWYQGAEAIYRARALAGRRGALWAYGNLPGFRTVSDWGYRWVAEHRALVSTVSKWLMGVDMRPKQTRLTRWIFLRLLGLTGLCAFLSLLTQMQGLFGSDGILPAAEHMSWVGEQAQLREALPVADPRHWHAWQRYLTVPTLAWVSTSDGFLGFLHGVGIVGAVLLIVDVLPAVGILAMWMAYLSLCHVGGVFLGYQWDVLLLESLVVGLLFAPWRMRPALHKDTEPHWIALWVGRFLLFKLMFLSGAVKLMVNDPTWESLTALEFHFFTQPIPTWTAYYAHHAPQWLLSTATFIMFAIELVLPWFVFGPRRLRFVFGLGTVFLMLAIGATGNYGFFNLLTAVLAVLMFDDSLLARIVPERWRKHLPNRRVAPLRSMGAFRARLCLAVGLVILLGSALTFQRELTGSRWGEGLLQAAAPFRSINAYGLFRRMTTDRPEIVLEGSHDGERWLTYELNWKPTRLDARPGFAGPHMPRLDWQMWFAALRGCRGARWFSRFGHQLLQGSESVRGLLAYDPFPDQPPRFLRSTRYFYTFGPLGDSGWWRRQTPTPFCPVMERTGDHNAHKQKNN